MHSQFLLLFLTVSFPLTPQWEIPLFETKCSLSHDGPLVCTVPRKALKPCVVIQAARRQTRELPLWLVAI